MSAYNTNSLPEYVEQNRDLLIGKTILGSKSADLFTLMTGVKGKTALNILSTDVQFGNGAECGWEDKGNATLSQRIMEPAYLKVNLSICEKTLLGKWAEYQVKIAADKVAGDLPFEEALMDTILTGVNKQLETMIWQGTKSDTSFDGILEILKTGALTTTGTTAYETIKNVIAQLPGESIDTDTVVFVGNDTYMEYVQELVAANLYHYDPANGEDGIKVPGTTIRVVGVAGLNGTKKVVAGRLSNFFYGTDMVSDKDTFDVWFSRDNREFRVAIEFAAAVQVAFPELIVVGTIQ